MKVGHLFQIVAFVAVLIASVGQVQASVIGPFSGSWDGTEPLSSGRLFRDGNPSNGSTQKAWPGVYNDSSFYKYEVFQFYNNGPADVVTVNGVLDFDSFLSAFRGTVFSNVLASNELNYLGDIGSSTSQPFSFLAPANSPFFVLANAASDGASPNSSTFSFTVSGNFVSSTPPSTVPEPTSMAVFGLGALGIAYRARSKSKCKA
jgi:hypothetical protein